MRLFIAASFFLSSFWITPAFAGLYEFCLSLPADRQLACFQEWARTEAQAAAQQRQRQQDQLNAQMEMQRQQALGLALFGSGAAALNGMNQGFGAMEHSMDWMQHPNLAPPVGPNR